MDISSPNLAAAVFGAATAGQWPAPVPCSGAPGPHRRAWSNASPSSDGELCRVSADGAATPQEAQATAIMISEARTMWELALAIAGESYASQAADLIDRARTVLSGVDGRTRAALAHLGSAPEGGESGGRAEQPRAAGLPTQQRAAAAAGDAIDPAGVVSDQDAMQRGRCDTLLVYVDPEDRTIRRRACQEAEARAMLQALAEAPSGGAMFTCESPFDINLVLDVSPRFRAAVEETVSKLKRDAELVNAMDRHGIPPDAALRGAVARLVLDLQEQGGALLMGL